MPRKLPPFVERWRDRHGKVRVYFRREKGPRIPLPELVGSEAFLTAYQEALASRPVKVARVRAPAAPGTIEALILSYKKSAEYVGLRDTTKDGYRRRLEIMRVQHGHRVVAGLTHGRIVKAFLDPLADKPGAALDTLKKLRILIRRAIVLGWLTSDPSVAIRRPKIGEVRSWTDEEITQFEARWPVSAKQRLAFALHLFTGQRRSDVHWMTWADVKGDRIRVVQQKTGAKIDIPLHVELRTILAETPRQHATILNTEYGKPFTVDGFSGFMRDAITAAGLPLDAQPHGLRKAAGRRLAQAEHGARDHGRARPQHSRRGRALHPRGEPRAALHRRHHEAGGVEGEQKVPNLIAAVWGKRERSEENHEVDSAAGAPKEPRDQIRTREL